MNESIAQSTEPVDTVQEGAARTGLPDVIGRNEVELPANRTHLYVNRPNSIIWGIVYCALLIYSIGSVAPFDLKFIHSSLLDESWGMTLNVELANHKQFGSDLIYSYGPYGFLAPGCYYPRTWLAYLTIRLVIAAVFCWIVIDLARELRARGTLPIAAFISLGTAVGVGTVGPDVFFPVCAGLLIIRYFNPSESRNPLANVFEIAALVAVIAVVALMKFPWMLFALGIVTVIGIDQLADPRSRRPWVPVAFALFIALLWAGARQTLTTVIPYVRQSVEFARGYNLAMALPGGRKDVPDFACAVFVFTSSVLLASWKYRSWRITLPTAALNILLFVLFKNAFVRHDDPHTLIAPLAMLSLEIFYVVSLWPPQSERLERIALVFALLVTATTASSILARNSGQGPLTLTIGSLRRSATSWVSLGRLIVRPEAQRLQYDSAMAEIRTANPLPHLNGTVDVYPNAQMAVFAHGLNYSPRPIFQSYATFTPAFETINVNHLRGNSAPDNILFDVATVDDRFPPFDDGLSWPELLTRYRIDQICPTFLVLKRTEPRGYELQPVSSHTITLDQKIAVPSTEEGPIWAKVDVRLNRRGQLLASAFRPTLLIMKLTTASGDRQFRFIPGSAEEGFLLSPLVETRYQFASLAGQSWQTDLRQNHIKSLKISVMKDGNVGKCYVPEISIEFFRLLYSHQDLRSITALPTENPRVPN